MRSKSVITERVVFFSALVLGGLFCGLFIKSNPSSPRVTSFETTKAIDYTMARPDSVFAEYSLDGREIEELYEGLTPEEVKLAKAGKLDKKKQELVAIKQAEIKKKQDLKKKQDGIVKTWQTMQTNYQAKVKAYQDYVKKAYDNFEANRSKPVVTGSNPKSNSGEVATNTYANNYTAPVQEADSTGVQPKKTDRKTFTEWRDLLFGNPTIENLGKFVSAFKKGDVSATEYQAMAQDLLAQSDQKQKGLGLMALRTVPSLLSLSQLVHVEAGLDAQLKTYVGQSINEYLQPQNLPYVAQAFGTKDRVLLSRTLNLLNTNLPKLNAGDFSVLVDPRNRRDADVTSFSMSSYHSLMPSLQQLSTSQDAELASLAQQVSSLIQSSNNVAIN